MVEGKIRRPLSRRCRVSRSLVGHVGVAGDLLLGCDRPEE